MRNIELKARLRDPERAEKICQELDAESQGVLDQRDTYFYGPNGRLKLRESRGRTPELIFYERENLAESTPSEYQISTMDSSALYILRKALSVLVIVNKVRRLWLWKNVRIHLDEVYRLGVFLEFEAVLDETLNQDEGYSRVTQLREAFGIEDSDLLSDSYSDMLLEKSE